LRKIPEAEARQTLETIQEARSYITGELWQQALASYYRLTKLENQIRTLLGEPLIPVYECWHTCAFHEKEASKPAKAEQ